jgi:hypothetical protein
MAHCLKNRSICVDGKSRACHMSRSGSFTLCNGVSTQASIRLIFRRNKPRIRITDIGHVLIRTFPMAAVVSRNSKSSSSSRRTHGSSLHRGHCCTSSSLFLFFLLHFLQALFQLFLFRSLDKASLDTQPTIGQ